MTSLLLLTEATVYIYLLLANWAKLMHNWPIGSVSTVCVCCLSESLKFFLLQ